MDVLKLKAQSKDNSVLNQQYFLKNKEEKTNRKLKRNIRLRLVRTNYFRRVLKKSVMQRKNNNSLCYVHCTHLIYKPAFVRSGFIVGLKIASQQQVNLFHKSKSKTIPTKSECHKPSCFDSKLQTLNS